LATNDFSSFSQRRFEEGRLAKRHAGPGCNREAGVWSRSQRGFERGSRNVKGWLHDEEATLCWQKRSYVEEEGRMVREFMKRKKTARVLQPPAETVVEPAGDGDWAHAIMSVSHLPFSGAKANQTLFFHQWRTLCPWDRFNNPVTLAEQPSPCVSA
jgi:hypothetical protein